MKTNKNEINYKDYIAGLDEYISDLVALEEENPERAREKSIESLIKTGVLDAQGNVKKQICE
ncbi:MAG: hypothetical protein SOX85_04675 [Lachnospiraceae bacterium]|nr:hypothetical protein [Lachnospiraceae bacterium]